MIFTGRKILKELRALRTEIAITTAVIRALTKSHGFMITVTRNEKDNTTMVALAKEGDNHVNFHPVDKEQTNG